MATGLQHALACPWNPRCNYRLTYAVLNHPDNQRSYNDGFRTLHHANSMIHWSEFPTKFIEKLDEHAARDALVFSEIGFFHVGLALFFKAHGYLADHYVNVGQPKRTREELIALMKERLRPMSSWGTKTSSRNRRRRRRRTDPALHFIYQPGREGEHHHPDCSTMPMKTQRSQARTLDTEYLFKCFYFFGDDDRL